MRFTTTKSNLVYAIQTVQRAISPRSPMPVLSGILFHAAADQLTATATDLDLTIECMVPVTVEEPGALVLPARFIGELARRLPDVPIEFKTSSRATTATINYGQSQSSIHGFSPEQFPDIPRAPEKPLLQIGAELLKDALRQVIFASSTDETRPIFTGVLFEVQNDGLTLVATDTHRLAWRKVPLTAEEPINVIVPGKTFNELIKIAGGGEENIISVSLAENRIFFAGPGILISSRMIAGSFPPYRQVIPEEFCTVVHAVTRELLEATERASLLINEGVPVVHFNLRQEACILSVHTETGWIREELNMQMEGEAMEISFNHRYLSDALRAVNSEKVIINLTGPLSAAVIRCPENEHYLSLLLPARPSRE